MVTYGKHRIGFDTFGSKSDKMKFALIVPLFEATGRRLEGNLIAL